ncbi:hypothetical protein GF339_11070 [candidate division KSB3 bacterium]|uniref:PA14 domain-containing protein n=1 Tax=candidate division KSB3 bacterium TaxID=2044937 RepID=A0A9D5JWB9_9BACT|nr:hypothetical protein [candidate division KSB3 bacterium]MBD3325117.1 hypothetical protein [candidate division KSB3 bacterium]
MNMRLWSSLFRKQHMALKIGVMLFGLLLLCEVAAHVVPVQRGLQGRYYPNANWNGPPAFSALDAPITLSTAHVRRLTFPTTMYSISWKGWIWIETVGHYRFGTRSDDGSDLNINGQQVVDNGGLHAPREVWGGIDLEPGFYQIDVKYFQGKGADSLEVFWQPPNAPRSVLPAAVLFPLPPPRWRLILAPAISPVRLLLLVLTLGVWGGVLIGHRTSLYQRIRGSVEAFTEHVLRYGLLVLRTARIQMGIGVLLFLIVLLILHGLQVSNGLEGRYYQNLHWDGDPALTTENAAFRLSSLVDTPSYAPQHPASFQWQGWLWIQTAAVYRFDVTTEGFLFLELDDVLVAEKRDNSNVQTVATRVYLTDGLHQIDLRYLPGTGAAYTLDVRWGRSDRSMTPIPRRLLFAEEPDETSLLKRQLVSWGYRGIRLLGILLLAIFGLVILVRQKLVYGRLVQTAVVQRMRKGVGEGRLLREALGSTSVHLLIILALSLLLVFNNLGRGSIITTDFDEGMHTRVAQYMAKTGVWWSLYSAEGVPYYNKPPLKIWLSALTLRLLGDSEFFLRIWDAVFGLALFLVLYFFGRELFASKGVGLLGVVILMGGRDFLLTHSIRTGVMDSLMLLFFVTSLFLFCIRKRHFTRYYALAGVCMGLGALTKSVQALVPLAILVVYLVLTRQHAEFKTRAFWGMVVLAIGLPGLWYVSQIFLSPGFFEVAIVQQIFHRVQGKIHPTHVHGPFYFFQVIYEGFFPWSVVAVPALGIGFWQAIRRHNTQMIFLLTWILTVFIGFSISKMKVVWYMHPLYPALALLIAAVFFWTFRVLKADTARPLLAPLALGLLVVLLASSLSANYERVVEEPRKLPIHLFTEYLQRLQEIPYHVVVYDLSLQEFDHADRYYLNRIGDERVLWTQDLDEVARLVRQGDPVFVIVTMRDYETIPFFQDHLSRYWLAPVYADRLYPKKLILVYNHMAESRWFLPR